MFGNGRQRFSAKGVAQVFVLIHYDPGRNCRRVYVYIHQRHGKMYTFFEKRLFYRSLKCKEYLETLGKGLLIVEVEETDD